MLSMLLEKLEGRALLAGNLTVTADANFNATITGDIKSNGVEITLFPDNSGYLLTGLKGTKINGNPTALIKTTSAFNFNIDMGGGSDKIVFTGKQLATQNLTIATGNGKDRVVLDGQTIFGDLRIGGGNARDIISVTNLHVTKNVEISTRGGKDLVVISGDIKVDGNVLIHGGNGKDFIVGAANVQVAGTTTLISITDKDKEDKKRKKEEDEKKKHHEDEDDHGDSHEGESH